MLEAESSAPSLWVGIGVIGVFYAIVLVLLVSLSIGRHLILRAPGYRQLCEWLHDMPKWAFMTLQCSILVFWVLGALAFGLVRWALVGLGFLSLAFVGMANKLPPPPRGGE